jgi:hypothetical protein
MSEGLNFSDNRARAVVITGLPFPPVNDPHIKLKKAFLDEKLSAARRAAGLSGGSSSSSSSWQRQREARLQTTAAGGSKAGLASLGLSGDEWYQQQASRAVRVCVYPISCIM